MKPPPSDSPHRDPSAGEDRKRRHELEALLDQAILPPDKLERVWQSLGDPDPRIRYTARTVLERQPLELWQQRALRETEPLAALTALSALAQAR